MSAVPRFRILPNRPGRQAEQSTDGLNQVVRYGLVDPGYRQDLSERRTLDFAYLPGEEVLLLGSMDGQYPYWVSVTGIQDADTNAAVADRILFGEFDSFTRTYPQLDGLMRHRYHRRFSLVGDRISTPFDYGLSSEPGQKKHWGRHVAEGIRRHYAQVCELARYRELGGRYLGLLEAYLGLLQERTSADDVANYEDKLALIRLMEAEDYLYASRDARTRTVYVEIRKKIGRLYNRYMSIVR